MDFYISEGVIIMPNMVSILQQLKLSEFEFNIESMEAIMREPLFGFPEYSQLKEQMQVYIQAKSSLRIPGENVTLLTQLGRLLHYSVNIKELIKSINIKRTHQNRNWLFRRRAQNTLTSKEISTLESIGGMAEAAGHNAEGFKRKYSISQDNDLQHRSLFSIIIMKLKELIWGPSSEEKALARIVLSEVLPAKEEIERRQLEKQQQQEKKQRLQADIKQLQSEIQLLESRVAGGASIPQQQLNQLQGNLSQLQENQMTRLITIGEKLEQKLRDLTKQLQEAKHPKEVKRLEAEVQQFLKNVRELNQVIPTEYIQQLQDKIEEVMQSQEVSQLEKEVERLESQIQELQRLQEDVQIAYDPELSLIKQQLQQQSQQLSGVRQALQAIQSLPQQAQRLQERAEELKEIVKKFAEAAQKLGGQAGQLQEKLNKKKNIVINFRFAGSGFLAWNIMQYADDGNPSKTQRMSEQDLTRYFGEEYSGETHNVRVIYGQRTPSEPSVHERILESGLTESFVLIDKQRQPSEEVVQADAREDLVINITIAGPQATIGGFVPGARDVGENSIENNIKAAIALVRQELGEDAYDSLTFNITGHSRGGVAASEFAKAIKKMYSEARVDLMLYDPVPGPGHTGIDCEIDLARDYSAKETEGAGCSELSLASLGDNDSSVVVYSLCTQYPVAFTPQSIANAKVVILTPFNHSVGLSMYEEKGGQLVHKPFVLGTEQFSEGDLNRLPPGVYMSDAECNLTLVTREKVEESCNKVREQGGYTQGSRTDILIKLLKQRFPELKQQPRIEPPPLSLG